MSFSAERSHPSTVAFAEISPDYKRTRLSSGRYRPESYAFAEGNLIDNTGEDKSLNALTFPEIGEILAGALLEADYVPTTSPAETELLIVVSWGRTTPKTTGLAESTIDGVSDAMRQLSELDEVSGDGGYAKKVMESEYLSELDQMELMQEMAQEARDQANAHNAELLGYQTALKKATEMANFAPMLSDRNELMSELEMPRYFVVLQVYDFQKLWKEKQRDLLWTTRFSIRAKGYRFDEELWAMAMATSREFGKKSKSLKRGLKPARVEFGELEYLGTEEE